MHNVLGHYLAMRIRRSVGLALGMALLVASSPASFAEATPTPSPSASPLSYQAAMEEFHNQMDARDQNRKDINSTFMAAVTAANKDAKSAMRKAKTAEAKTAILVLQKNAIALATSVRDAAIAAMGPPPIEPVKPAISTNPIKQSEPTKPSKSPKESKPTEPSEQTPVKKKKSD